MGIIIISILWSVSSLVQLGILCNYSGYQHMFGSNYLPASWVVIRYIGSLAQRILGLTAGLGLWWKKRWAALIIIILSVFNLVTVFWKHPYEAMRNVAVGNGFVTPGHNNEQFIWFFVILNWVLNELFFGFTIYYLTRPGIRSKLK